MTKGSPSWRFWKVSAFSIWLAATRPSYQGAGSVELADPLHVPAADLVGGSQELDHPLELLGREAGAQAPLPVGRQRPPDLVGACVELGCHLDLDPAAVPRVGDATGVAGALQPVDHAGHRSAGEPPLPGALPRGWPAGGLDRVQAVEVGAVHPEPLGGEVVEGTVLVAGGPELAHQLVDQLLLLFAGLRHTLLFTKIFIN